MSERSQGCWKWLAAHPERNNSSDNQSQYSTKSIVIQEPHMGRCIMVAKGQQLHWLHFALVIPMNCNNSEWGSEDYLKEMRALIPLFPAKDTNQMSVDIFWRWIVSEMIWRSHCCEVIEMSSDMEWCFKWLLNTDEVCFTNAGWVVNSHEKALDSNWHTVRQQEQQKCQQG